MALWELEFPVRGVAQDRMPPPAPPHPPQLSFRRLRPSEASAVNNDFHQPPLPHPTPPQKTLI